MGLSNALVKSHRHLLVAVFYGLSVAPVLSEPSTCDDRMFKVDATDERMAGQLCTMATEIRGHLESCGLKQSRALTIEITDDVSHPLANCLAYFDCEYDLVRILDPSTWNQVLEQDEAYGSLPADVTLRALVTHELAHALVVQVAGDREVPMVLSEQTGLSRVGGLISVQA